MDYCDRSNIGTILKNADIPGATHAKVIVPTSCRTEMKRGAKSAIKVFCRKIDKFNVEVQSLTADDQKSLDSRAKHMGYLTSHEANCGPK